MENKSNSVWRFIKKKKKKEKGMVCFEIMYSI